MNIILHNSSSLTSFLYNSLLVFPAPFIVQTAHQSSPHPRTLTPPPPHHPPSSTPPQVVLHFRCSFLHKTHDLVKTSSKEVERRDNSSIGAQIVFLHDFLIVDCVSDIWRGGSIQLKKKIFLRKAVHTGILHLSSHKRKGVTGPQYEYVSK